MAASLIIVLLTALSVFPTSNSELFTALVHMENLVSTEHDLATSLQRYLAAEEERLNRIKTLAHSVTNISDAATEDVSKYLGHPVNAYRLLRRFVSDWKEVEDLLTRSSPGEGTIVQTSWRHWKNVGLFFRLRTTCPARRPLSCDCRTHTLCQPPTSSTDGYRETRRNPWRPPTAFTWVGNALLYCLFDTA
eukprot:m.265699 g.265699  ORF g.265699 m.265699 type:complete len:191 (+) comp40493_c2_seq1:122-694(+)